MDNTPIPPELANDSAGNLISTLWKQMGVGGSSMEDLVAELGRQVMDAKSEAEEARHTLGVAQAEPMPTTNPLSDMLTRSIGSAAAGLTGREQPRQTAAQFINDEQMMLNKKRAENLAQLEDAYKRAAERATKMGDVELEIKMRSSFDKAAQDRATIMTTMNTLLSHKLEEQRQAGADKAAAGRQERQLDVQKSLTLSENLWKSQQNDLDREANRNLAFISQGIDPNTGEALTQSYKYRITFAKQQGFLDTATRSKMVDQLFDDVKKTSIGLGGTRRTKYDAAALRVRLLRIPPDISFALTPDKAGLAIIDALDPNDPTGQTPLYPRDKNGDLKEPWKTQFNRYMNTYFPGKMQGP